MYAVAITYVLWCRLAVYDSEGKILFSGRGYAVLYAAVRLFQIHDDFSFHIKTRTTTATSRLSLLEYLPDERRRHDVWITNGDTASI